MPSEERQRYAPLLTEDPEYLDTKFSSVVSKSTRPYGHLVYWVIVSVQTLVILVLVSTVWHRKGSQPSSYVVYCTFAFILNIYVDIKSDNTQPQQRMCSR